MYDIQWGSTDCGVQRCIKFIGYMSGYKGGKGLRCIIEVLGLIVRWNYEEDMSIIVVRGEIVVLEWSEER